VIIVEQQKKVEFRRERKNDGLSRVRLSGWMRLASLLGYDHKQILIREDKVLNSNGVKMRRATEHEKTGRAMYVATVDY
jgi:hypothetical protein